eukprot:TRINITY_DN6259_c0_g1_i2.p1 TRINITY_DN6259_c0_g1~~TRINITY_DN6259_c0_g1_i2.p1  ORF type:complete len:326 (-),score=59.37 TRINITY_DN6259_c0_g1_i2:595-1572(-)
MKHWSSKVRAKMAGVDEEKTNYGDLQDQSAILEGVSVKFREIIKETTKNQKYITQQSEADPRISDSLLRTGVDFNEIDRPMLSSTLELVGNFHNVTNDHRLKLLESIQSDVIDNLQSFVSTEIKEAKNQKVEYDRERAKCDEAQNELKIAKKSKKTKPEKLQALEENYQNLQDSHQLVGEKTLRQIKDTQDLAEIDMMERLCDYLDIFREYHTECIRLLNEKVPEIWEYRRYIDEVSLRFLRQKYLLCISKEKNLNKMLSKQIKFNIFDENLGPREFVTLVHPSKLYTLGKALMFLVSFLNALNFLEGLMLKMKKVFFGYLVERI